jgi:hypothetical protein
MKSAFIIVFIAIAATMISLNLLKDLKGDAEYAVATFVCILAITLGIAIIVRIQYNQLRKALPRLREKYPVTYFCSWELASDVNFITSDKEFIKIWQLKKNDFVELLTLDRKTMRLEKGDVRVAVLRKTKGAVLIDKMNPAARVPINICRDDINAMLPSLKGADLETAMRRIEQGS